MFLRRVHLRAISWLPALALAAYGVIGVFGHSLHGLLPCSDAQCAASRSADIVDSCSGGSACSAVAAEPAKGPECRSAGHDPANCTLCAVLAQIRVGKVTIFTADVGFARTYNAPPLHESVRAADRVLACVPRGPPAC